MKKILSLILIVALLLVCLAGCGSANTNVPNNNSSENPEQIEQTTEQDSNINIDYAYAEENWENKNDQLSGVWVYETGDMIFPLTFDGQGDYNGPLTFEGESDTMVYSGDYLFNGEQVVMLVNSPNGLKSCVGTVTPNGKLTIEGVKGVYVNETYGNEHGRNEQIPDGMAYAMKLYCYETDSTLVVELDNSDAFVEPENAQIEDYNINYFRTVHDDFKEHELDYYPLNMTTSEIADMFIERFESEGKDNVYTTEPTTFKAGGVEWEIFDLVYTVSGTAEEKETGEEYDYEYTYYEPCCFARFDNGNAVQIDGNFKTTDENASEIIKEVVMKSIKSIVLEY